MLADHVDVVIGVDTHKLTHTAAALSPAGAVLEQVTVPADPKGYRRLVAFAERHGQTRLWAIEGTGSFGAGLTTALLGRQERVIEVDRPKRPARRAGPRAMTSMPCAPPGRCCPATGPANLGAEASVRRSVSCSLPGRRPSSSARGPSPHFTPWS